jgi:hypothetical protein
LNSRLQAPAILEPEINSLSVREGCMVAGEQNSGPSSYRHGFVLDKSFNHHWACPNPALICRAAEIALGLEFTVPA